MLHGIQLYQPSLNGLGQEVALAELPGELWPTVEALAECSPELFIDYRPQELASTCSCMHTLKIQEYMQRRKTITGAPHMALELLRPYISAASDSGYNHVILTA